MSAGGDAVVLVVVVLVVVVDVAVDEGVVVVAGVVEVPVGVVAPVPEPELGELGAEDDVGLPEVVLVVGVPGLVDVEVVDVPLDEDEDEDVEVDVALVDESGFEEVVSKPLLFSWVSICCWTDVTADAIAVGVPLAPSAGSALSC